MAKTFECGTCGVISEEKEHLCKPESLSGKHEYCGTPGEGASMMCEPMKESHEYECGNCGRPAEKADLLCNPAKVS